MSDIKLSVRPATPNDALAIGEVQADAMAEALSAALERDLSHETRASLDGSQLASTWMMTIGNMPSEDHHVLVADSGGTVQGFAAVVPAEPIILDGDDPAGLDADTGEPRVAFEITNFDVPQRFADAEHEARLLAAITDIIKDSGGTELHMWVIAGNDAQTQFLNSAGFAPRPVRRVAEVDGGEVAEHLWWTLLNPEPEAA